MNTEITKESPSHQTKPSFTPLLGFAQPHSEVPDLSNKITSLQLKQNPKYTLTATGAGTHCS